MYAEAGQPAQVLRVANAAGSIDLFAGQPVHQRVDVFQVGAGMAAYPLQVHDDNALRQPGRPGSQSRIAEQPSAAKIQ